MRFKLNLAEKILNSPKSIWINCFDDVVDELVALKNGLIKFKKIDESLLKEIDILIEKFKKLF